MNRYAVFAVCLLAAVCNAHAQSGTPYTLNWNVKGEQLTYRSCGCADACWVAEVRSTKPGRRTVAKLRCDCEKLYFSTAKGTETVISESCAPLDGEGKMELIPTRIKELQSREGRK